MAPPRLTVGTPAPESAFPVGPSPFAAFLASAPLGIDNSYLGAPVDARFAPIQGPGGASLFPTGGVRHDVVNQMDHRMLYVADSVEFDANVHAWGIVSAGLGADNSLRYAAYRAYQVESVDTLDDRVAGRAPPPGAVAYISAIHRGHLFEGVLSGSASAFHAGVQARLGVWTGGIKAFASTESLDFSVTGMGLAPKTGDALFAWSVDDIAAKYTAAGQAVPIFVEYRGIPGTALDRHSIAWAHAYRVDFRFTQFRVQKDGAWFFDPKWNARAVCRKNGGVLLVDNQSVMPPGSKVSSGQSYPISWQQTFKGIGPGDSITCGVNGTYVTQGGAYPMPEAMSDPIVPNGASPTITGSMFGSNASAGYAVDYTVIVAEET